jgi:hypothetical protein
MAKRTVESERASVATVAESAPPALDPAKMRALGDDLAGRLAEQDAEATRAEQSRRRSDLGEYCRLLIEMARSGGAGAHADELMAVAARLGIDAAGIRVDAAALASFIRARQEAATRDTRLRAQNEARQKMFQADQAADAARLALHVAAGEYQDAVEAMGVVSRFVHAYPHFLDPRRPQTLFLVGE